MIRVPFFFRLGNILNQRGPRLGTPRGARPIPWRPGIDGVAPSSPSLVQEVRAFRENFGLLNREGMGRNVGVARVRINGREEFIVRPNVPGIHSEEAIALRVRALRARGDRVDVLELLTERIPCFNVAGCMVMIAQDMPGVRVFFFTRNKGRVAINDLWDIWKP